MRWVNCSPNFQPVPLIMAIVTPLTRLLGITHPLLLAPMAQIAGGRLAAAVSGAGGLGFIGGGYGDPTWLARECALAGDARIGIGLITWRLPEAMEALALALARRPCAVWLSFGDIAPYVAPIRAAGAKLLAQVQSVAQARAARDLGADVIIAQGCEAGGHAGLRATLPLVPAVVDAVAPLPVVAAGGIADGRGVAAALLLGAAGVVLGSRFYTATESLATPAARAAAIAASGDDTVRSAAFDRLRGWPWPPGYALRSLRNALTERWSTDPAAAEARLDALRADFARAIERDDVRSAPVLVGEAVDLVRDEAPAADLIARIVTDARTALGGAAALLAR